MYNENNLKLVIKKELENSIQEMYYNSFKSEFATKSSKRTDVLHNGIKAILNKIIEPSFKIKHNIFIKTDVKKTDTQIEDAYGKKISCDLIMGKKNKLKIPNDVFLIKAPISSINKNFQNANNNVFGEFLRILIPKKNQNINVYSINIIPTYAPVFDSHKNIKKFEKVRLNEEKKDQLKGFGILFEQTKKIDILYDINDKIKEAKNQDEIFKIIKEIISNEDSLIKINNFEDFYDIIVKIKKRYLAV